MSGTVKSAGNIKTNKMSPLPLSILWASGGTDLGSKYSVISAVRDLNSVMGIRDSLGQLGMEGLSAKDFWLK